jgi:hypothetical protein
LKKNLKQMGELQKQVIKKVVEKKIIKQVENDFDVFEVDLGMEIRGFINFQWSKETQKNYKRWVDHFLDYCMGEK